MLGDDSPDIHVTNGLCGFRAMGDTLSNVESQVFTPYNFGSSRDRTSNLVTTRPTCYHSATALNYMPYCRVIIYFVAADLCVLTSVFV